MARDLKDFPNITAPDTQYPSGRIKDESGAGDGTPVNEYTNGDIVQFFYKMIREAGFTPNKLPDNEYNGSQFFEALQKTSRPYKSYCAIISQSGTNAPTGDIGYANSIGSISWVRNSTGNYSGGLIGAFPLGRTQCVISGSVIGFCQVVRGSANAINITTCNVSGVASDDILDRTFIEIKVFPTSISFP